MTYVLDNLPEPLEAELRRKAAAEGKTVPQLVVEQLQQVNKAATSVKKRDLSDIAGKWVDDPIFDEIRAELERVDPNDWK